MTRLRQIHLPTSLISLLLVSFVLMVAWSLAVPIFEVPDEPAHWLYASYIHQYGQLPEYTPEYEEASSPPLYYVLVAPFAVKSEVPEKSGWIDAQGVRHKSPGSRLFQNSNSDFAKYWPLRIVRLVTAVMSVLSVLACYCAAKEATGSQATGLLAAGLMALLPMFTFRGMNISDDMLMTLLCAVSTYLIIHIMRRGFTWRVGVMAALVMGLAYWAKVNAVFLSVPFALAVLWERVPWRTRLVRLSVLLITLGVVAPWLVYNQINYGDPFAANRAVSSAVAQYLDPKPITSPYFYTIFPLLMFHSFIGGFGWMTLWMPEWLYLLFGLFFLVSIIGCAVRWIRHTVDRQLVVVLLTMPLLCLIIAVIFNLPFTQPQGRYFFPALTALAILGAMGLEAIPGWSERLTWWWLGMLIALNLYILVSVIIPAYWSA